MVTTQTHPLTLNEAILRHPRHPVHRIADALIPYLERILQQVRPDQIILFGSYAYGEPTSDSDVDLLIVKPIEESPAADATQIRRIVRPLRHSGTNLPLDIMVRDPADFQRRIQNGSSLHCEIAQRGLALLRDEMR
jgi:predicted nucleotidyltransferase